MSSSIRPLSINFSLTPSGTTFHLILDEKGFPYFRISMVVISIVPEIGLLLKPIIAKSPESIGYSAEYLSSYLLLPGHLLPNACKVNSKKRDGFVLSISFLLFKAIRENANINSECYRKNVITN